MSFIESYKHLDKICGEMFETQYGVSAYIEEMLNNPRGSFLVRGWENDLKQLKHYRWIRNQIVHEPDCYEETMCEAGDDEWLDHILKNEIGKVIDWSKVDKEDYLLAMERSPIKDVEIKVLLKGALTDEINSREVYMKGIDHSYYYEGYTTFKTEEL